MAKIGLIQTDMTYCKYSIAEKQDMMYNLAENCLKDGADVVLFPESYQYTDNREILNDRKLLITTAENWKQRLSALSKKYSAYLIPWDYYVDGDKIFNSSYILDRCGEEIGRYKKCNLTHSEMSRGISHGMEYPVFDLDFGKVGIMICFDNYFPESASILGAKGANVIFYPLYGDTMYPQWQMKLRTRAIDNSCYVVSCQNAPEYDISFTGIVDPSGEIVAKLDKSISYKVVDIDVGKPFISHTYGKDYYRENLHEYLHKCRNYKAFKEISEEGHKAQSWDKIFYGNIPED